jgi:hypothetical protein
VRWACQIFNVHVVTNAIYDYAKQVLNILDPKKEHLLKNIQNDSDLSKVLKTRENLIKLSNSKFGIKNLTQFSWDVYESVILGKIISFLKKMMILMFGWIKEMFYLFKRLPT